MIQRLLAAYRRWTDLNIERVYKTMDAAVAQLRQESERNAENAENGRGEPPAMNELTSEAMEDAERLLAMKGEKNWDGLFREMHEYLAKIYMEFQQYDEALEQARYVTEYDRHEGEYLEKQIEAHRRGERLEDYEAGGADETDDDTDSVETDGAETGSGI